MPIRVLTGILMTNGSLGQATVSFRPHDIEGDARGVSLWEMGPDKPFRHLPGRLVALREISADAKAAGIDDKQLSERMLKVSWRGAREIAYLIVGEVDDD
jgi:hypothetical protein